MTNKIHPCIWFDNQGQEAAKFYCSIFPNSKITVDTPMVVNFELEGHKFMGLNGGPMFKPNPSISFFVFCTEIEETNYLWEQLSEAGNIMMPLNKYPWSENYGWCNDRFGVSWQIYFGKKEDFQQKISPNIMFVGDQCGRATEAMQFYTNIFQESSIGGILHYDANDADSQEFVKHAEFKMENELYMAMDSSAPHKFEFTEGISFVIDCEKQEEIDYYWEHLTQDGTESCCGWLKDKFGISWQVVPTILGKLMQDPNKSSRVIQAFMQMSKFDIQTLINA
jgi:predicted 3-demethylubiquinone-9 3-methyltransferase (glyoxalase superfamily)